MLISDFAIKRPIVTITSMVALVAFGIAGLFNLQTDEFPDVQQPVISVSIVYPGASPETVEREIVEPIEESFSSIAGVDWAKTISNATDGLAQFTVFFDFEKNLQEASQDIRDAISTKRADLPQEMEEPVLARIDPGEAPVMSLSLTSDSLAPAALSRLADPEIVRVLRGVRGVARVSVVGQVKRELTVQLRPADLQAAGLSVDQVVQALQAQNLAAPVGRLTGALDERNIRLKGRLESPADFAGLVVAERNGRVIRLGQVADALDGIEEPRTAALFNGREAVGIEIRKAKGYSTTRVSADLRAEIAKLQPTLPRGVGFAIVQDAGERVAHAVRNVEEALVEGALLTVSVVFLFLNSWRSTVITGLALPVSVLASFIAVWAFGFTLNTMSLMGLSLAIGILIDDAIVVRENIVRHVEMGKDHFLAAREGTDEIGLAVAATTFSIVGVFVPVAFMYGVAGQWFKPFALTIACSVLVSLFVSFSLDPMLSAYWTDPHQEEHEKSWITRRLDRFNAWFNRVAEGYKGVIGWALDHRWSMALLASGSFVGALVLQATVGGAGFIPISDRSEAFMTVEAPPGSNLAYSKLKAEEAARIARAHPEVAYTYTSIGVPLPLKTPSVDQALVYVRLVPKANRHISQDAFGRLLRSEVSRVAGAQVSVYTSGFGGALKSLQIQIKGPDAATLQRLADQAMTEARKVPGAVDIGLSTRGQKPELDIALNRSLAGSIGVTVGQVALALRPAFAGIDAGDWVDPSGETRDVTIRLAPEARERVADLERLPLVVPAQGGGFATLPLGQIASITPTLGPAQIDHLNRVRQVTLEANVAGRPFGQVNTELNQRVRALPLPPGYEITQGGEGRDQQEIFGRIFTALGIAVLLMYLILVMQFGSFLTPLTILVALPLSLIGVVLALLVTGDTLNIMSLIGVILLMGIVAKNSILLIDFAEWAMEKGMSRRDALIQAGAIRLRPIIMTTLALIAGMIPVALGLGEGADFRAPLGRAVIGGTLTSTLLTLIVIPTIYEIMDDWRQAALRLLGRLLNTDFTRTIHETDEHRVGP
jgi:hydrophobic/amphiphilic exporter-1 (mainly G- bacteria), HAE1 family